MAADTIKTNTLISTLALVIAAEAAAWWSIRVVNLAPMLALGMLRLVQIIGMAWLTIAWQGNLQPIGLDRCQWQTGLKKGVLWSLIFALVAGLGMSALWLWGQNPLLLLRAPLPKARDQLLLFFLVGGLIGPIAEEICFRGILYTYFRSWGIYLAERLNLSATRQIGITLAVLGSTLIFVALHSIHGLPLTQIVGGLVFAAAYEVTRNLIVPMIIHVTGNLAIFGISLLPLNFIS
jgi:membrane protease YdiL (CAAX protease family)